TNSYYQLMLSLVPIWAVMGLSWNLFSGYSGLTSFGHAAFFGLGAYTGTLALVYWSLTGRRATAPNGLAAKAAGIDARTWKMRALIASGAMAAASGGLYACVLLVVTPDSVFGVLISAQALVVPLFGGVA